jgi:putative ABC transport system ATP-binding protein
MIQFKNVSLSYGSKEILRRFSLDIREGEKAAVLGKSGLGKTSLFYLLLGFVPAQEGSIFFNGVPVNEKTVWDVRKKTAFVDQDVSIRQGKAMEWIRSAFEFKANAGRRFSSDRLEALLDYFELSADNLEKENRDLSGGERQRVALITAVLLGRRVFLLDEVTSALDTRLKKKTVEFFLREDDWTVLAISHDPAWVVHPKVRTIDLEELRWRR